MNGYKQTSLWKTAFDHRQDGSDDQRDKLAGAYEEFRGRVSLLLAQIQKELPNLTLHDITHVDALWRVASEIAGPEFPLNPAEALVLGGAFLLHDAVHCRAAYPGGLAEIRETIEWRDAAAQRNLDPNQLDFMLDLAGYTPDRPLHHMRLLEPSFGGGEFLLAAVERLMSAFQAAGGEGDLSPCIRAV